jgi:hypothetical protein
MSDQVETERVELYKEKLSALISMSPNIFNEPSLKVEKMAQWHYDEFVTRLIDFVWSEHLETQEIRMPEDWWQAFKERWFPKWYLKRNPVKYITKRIEAKALYPKLRMPSQTPVIQISQMKQRSWWNDTNGMLQDSTKESKGRK